MNKMVNRLRKIAWASIFCFPFDFFRKSSEFHVHVSMFPFLHVHVSMFPCFHVSMFPEFRKWKMELTENDHCHIFAASRKQKRRTSVCLLQTEKENRSLFSLVDKRSVVIDDCSFSERSHLCKYVRTASFHTAPPPPPPPHGAYIHVLSLEKPTTA
jgi:hypothetical protein